MGEKTAGVGHFAIPAQPAAGTSVTSGAANTLTTTYVVLSASAPAALYITGIYTENAAVTAATYIIVQLATGGAGSETVVGHHMIAPVTGSTVARCYKPIYPPIPIANATRIAVKTADSVGALATLITLECINQSNVVDDGVAVGTVTTVTNQLTAAQIATGVWQDATAGDFTVASSVGKSVYTSGATPGAAGGHFIAGTNAATTITTGLTTTFTGNLTGSVASVTGAVGSVTGLTASNLDTTVSSRMATYTQPTGFLAATFPATVASTTNITSAAGVALAASQHVIVDSGTVTTLTNLPAITANWLTAAGIAASALNGKGDWNIGKTGYSLTQTFPTNFSTLAITVGGAVTAGTVSDKTGYSLTQTFPSNFSSLAITAGGVVTNADTAAVTAIKAKTDSLTFTAAGFVDSNILKVNGTTVTGAGTAGSPWGP